MRGISLATSAGTWWDCRNWTGSVRAKTDSSSLRTLTARAALKAQKATYTPRGPPDSHVFVGRGLRPEGRRPYTMKYLALRNLIEIVNCYLGLLFARPLAITELVCFQERTHQLSAGSAPEIAGL